MPGAEVVILGAGPAGMACAYELFKNGVPSRVIDRHSQVGGLLRTLERDGYLFDIGGHRFLSKSEEINALWREILKNDLLRVQRQSRILYNGKYFIYPLRAWDTVAGLGLGETLRCLLSYLKARVRGPAETRSFEDWMIGKFGRHLYEIFFKTYTEKVWGIPCSEISSDWACQRIQGLSLWSAALKALFPQSGARYKTLSDEFFYPVLGPGQFYERLRETTQGRGVEYLLGTEAKELHYENGRISHVVVQQNGHTETLRAESFFSSIPLTHLIRNLRPEAPPEIRAAASKLRFRSFIVVYLIVRIPELFPDNWIYIHSPEIRAGRIQNYKNWSARMVPDPATSSIGVEYFVNEDDAVWRLSDEEMVRLGVEEMEKLGFRIKEKLVRGFVARVPNAYPVYDEGYQQNTAAIRSYLGRFSNLQVLGRAGLFRYNNSDHALLTGLYGARNILGAQHDLWSIDIDGYEP